MFRVDNGGNRQIRAYLPQSRFHSVLKEFRLLRAGMFQILLVRDTLLENLALEIFQKPLRLIFHKHVGNIGGNIGGDLFDQRVLKFPAGRRFALLFDGSAQMIAQFRQRVKFGNVLGKFVVQFRHVLLFDFLHFYLKDGIFSGQFLRVIFGECDVQRALFARFRADKLLLKAGDKAVRPQFQRVVFALAARERRAVQKSLIVNHDGVAFPRFALHADKAGIAVGQLSDPGFHVLIRHGDFHLGRGQAFVLSQSDFGIHGDRRLKGKAGAIGPAVQFHFRHPDGPQFLLFHSRVVSVRERGVDRLLIEHLRAVHPLNDFAGGFPWAESRHTDFPARFAVGFFNGGVKLFRLHLNGQKHPAFFQLFT